MIFGAHDCITYKKPRLWYLRPLAWTARCQDKSIEELVKMGVRCFDFRVRFKKNKAVLCHGIMEYDGDLLEIIKFLNNFEGIYIRLGYENIYDSKDMDLFLTWAKGYIDTFDKIKFLICYKKPQWTVVLNCFDIPFYEVQEVPTWKTILKGPKGLSDKQNFDLYEGDNVIVSGDFIHNYL